MTTYAPCTDCSGEIIVGEFHPIVVPLLDAEGWPTVDPTNGKVRTIRLQLPAHRVALPVAAWDPTGLAHAECPHGIPEHPLGFPLRYGGQSWIRSKYVDVRRGGVTCPVCRGEPAPEDLTTPRTQ